MPRGQRKESTSGCYHVTMRGNGRQLLFESDHDRHRFLDLLRQVKHEYNMMIIAWCLMDNHVHVLVRCSTSVLSDAMGYTATEYARYFNARTGHVGHVFQSRFASAPVETDSHLLEAVRYIHQNPAKAGISSADTYYWSSYGEYLGANRGLADPSMVLAMLGDVESFKTFSKDKGEPTAIYENRRLTESEIEEVASSILPDGLQLHDVGALRRKERNAYLCTMREKGLSIRQIERLTGIGRGAIENATS